MVIVLFYLLASIFAIGEGNNLLELSKRSGKIDACPSDNVNAHGGVVVKNIAKVNSWQECANHCIENDQCNTWTWLRPGNAWALDCNLRKTVDYTNVDKNCISGTRDCQGNTVNIALKGKATQSTTRSAGGKANRALDGNTSGDWNKNSCTHTKESDKGIQWWSVKLEKKALIEKVKIFNRADCCSDRLNNVIVYLSNENPTDKKMSKKSFHECGRHNGKVGSNTEITCGDSSKEYQYVIVTLAQAGILTLCEVQVFPGLPKKDDVCSMGKVIKNRNSKGGENIGKFTESECVEKCLADDTCLAIDVNKKKGTCWIHKTVSTSQKQKCCNRYEKTQKGCTVAGIPSPEIQVLPPAPEIAVEPVPLVQVLPPAPEIAVDPVPLVQVLPPAPVQVKTYGGDANGAVCMFPFQYKGQSFNECTDQNNNGILWCSTAGGRWGNCKTSEQDGTHGGNANGAKCMFPFKYSGKSFNECTEQDNNGVLWCYTDTDGHYGNC